MEAMSFVNVRRDCASAIDALPISHTHAKARTAVGITCASIPTLSRKTVPPGAWIFMTALAVRLVHVWQMRATPFFSVLLGDSRGYDEWARRIAAGEWIGRDVFYQAPLYPYLLGVIYAVAGRHLLLVRIVQVVIGSASSVFLALAAERLVSRRAGIAAGLMLALYAPAIFFDGLIQKSVLDVFFLCLVLYLIARIAVRRKPDRHALWFLLGLSMGALALTRENALVFILVIVAWALVCEHPPTITANPQPPIPTPLARRATRAAAFAGGLAVL